MASEIPLNRIINQEIYVPKSGYCGWALVWCPKSNEAGHMNNEGEEGGNLGLEKLQQRGQYQHLEIIHLLINLASEDGWSKNIRREAGWRIQ